MMKQLYRAAGMLLCFPLLTFSAPASAQTYPSKPIHLAASSTPGSSVDLFGRAVADYLSRVAGLTAVVENRPGAGGTIAAAYTLNSGADGHVVLVNSSAHVSMPTLFPQLPFDALKDFVGVPIAVLPNVLIVPAERRWNTLQDLVTASKAKPGGLFYGTVGSGTSTHMSAELFRRRAQIAGTQVNYKGSPEVAMELAAGRLDWAFLPLSSVLPLLKDGRIRAIASSAPRRPTSLQEIPTLQEAGLADADFPLWVALFVPAKAPPAALQRLQAETARMLTTHEMREQFDKLGAAPMPMAQAEFAALLRQQAGEAAAIIKLANIKPN